MLFQAKTFKYEKFVTPGIRIKKIIKETHIDFRNPKIREVQEPHE